MGRFPRGGDSASVRDFGKCDIRAHLCLQMLGHLEIRVLFHLYSLLRLHSGGCRGLLGNQTRVRAGRQWLGLADCDVLPLCAGHDALGCAAIAGKEGAFHISGHAEEEAAYQLVSQSNDGIFSKRGWYFTSPIGNRRTSKGLMPCGESKRMLYSTAARTSVRDAGRWWRRTVPGG